MCVIFQKDAGVIIDPSKIENAQRTNKDGFGLTWWDGKKFNLRKWLTIDPDEINKILEDMKDIELVAHLRFKTKGAVDKSNLHPFTTLTEKTHGERLMFYHNGTIHTFGDDKNSDSKAFNQEILRPLLSMGIKQYGSIKKALENPFIDRVIEEFRPSSSVFVLHGEGGQVWKYGEGAQFDGWWSSNDYYFADNVHRTATGSRYTSYAGQYGGHHQQKKYNPPVLPSTQNGKAGGTTTKNQTQTSLVKTPTKSGGGTSMLPSVVSTVKPTRELQPSPSEMRVFDEYFEDMDDLFFLSSDDIQNMVKKYPVECGHLIRVLIQELYEAETVKEL